MISEITESQVKALIQTFGLDSDKKIRPIEFAVNTDRADTDLAKSIKDTYESLIQASMILNVEVSELMFEISRFSDHRVAEHCLDFNVIKGCVHFNNELWKVESEDVDVGLLTLSKVGSQENKQVAFCKVEPYTIQDMYPELF